MTPADRLRRLAADATLDRPSRWWSMNEADVRLIALAPSMAALLADMTEALASYDHSDDDCQGECVPGTRKDIYERDFAPLVERARALADGTEETT